MIDILIPVLGRPQNAAPLVDNIRAVTTVQHTITFVCSQGDDEQKQAVLASGIGVVALTVPWTAGPGDYAMKINRALSAVDNDWLFMAADDITFEPRWDTIALKVARDKYDVVATNDMANAQVRRGQFGTHCLIRRRYITEMGGTASEWDDGRVVLHDGTVRKDRSRR